MTNAHSLRNTHTKLLRDIERGEYLQPLFTEMSRLVVAATDYATELEAQIADPEALLAKNRKIGAIWQIADAQAVRPDLTDDQAWEVLQAVDRNQSAEEGISWGIIEDTANEMFPLKEEAA